jgi:hypothetical protein
MTDVEAMNKEAIAYAYREAGKAVAAFALTDDAISIKSKNPAIWRRANEIEATISLAGPYAQLKHDPATDIGQARQGEWASEELAAKARAADAVLCESRPNVLSPGVWAWSGVMLELEEAAEAIALYGRLEAAAKAFVAARWLAISSVAAVLMEGDSLTGDEIQAIIRAHPPRHSFKT